MFILEPKLVGGGGGTLHRKSWTRLSMGINRFLSFTILCRYFRNSYPLNRFSRFSTDLNIRNPFIELVYFK